MQTSVSLLVEIPEALHDRIIVHPEQKPDKDMDSIATIAIATYLASCGDRAAARIYLEEFFKESV